MLNLILANKSSLKKISPNQLQKTLSEASVLFSKGDLEASEKALNQLIFSFPSHPEVLSKLGTIYLYQDKLNEGIQLIKKSLEVNPYQPDILNNYAVALLNISQPKEALNVINKAILLKPNYIDAHYHQGLIYRSLDLYDEALKSYQKTTQLKSDHENARVNSAAIFIQLEKYHDAISILNEVQLLNPSLGYFYNLGFANLKVGCFNEAARFFNEVINQNPKHAEAWNNLGLALIGLENFESALKSLDKAISLNNQYTEAFDNKGLLLIKLERFNEALTQFQIALELEPNNHKIYNNLATANMHLREFNTAITNCNFSLKLSPLYAEAFNIRGLIYCELLEFDKALFDFNQAIELKAEHAEAINNRGLLFANQSLFEKAILDFEFASKLNPKLTVANFNLSIIYLLQLKFKEGWINFEKRRDVFDHLKKNEFLNKIYLTEIPQDQAPILLYSEQGIGDQILYLSLLPELAALPNQILVYINPRLLSLFKRSFPAIDFLSNKEIPNPSLFKYHALIGSIPQFFRRSKESFSNQKNSFLIADKNKTSVLRQNLKTKDNLVCGIAWKSKNEKIGHFKTSSLTDFLPILKLTSINFVDLQYGDTSQDSIYLRNEHNIRLTKIEDIDNFNDIDGLASLIDACDFIVTISNVTAHIAGALGKKVYLMVPHEKGRLWYWHDGLKKSLWYPSVEIFSQNETGDWSAPINQIKEKIEKEIAHE